MVNYGLQDFRKVILKSNRNLLESNKVAYRHKVLPSLNSNESGFRWLQLAFHWKVSNSKVFQCLNYTGV